MTALFRPLGRLTFFACAKKVSKETHPDIRVSLRETSLPPAPLRGPAYKGHPWPFKPLAASMRLVPLRNTYARPTDGESARMRVSRFRPLGVVGMPRRRAGATRATGPRGFHPPYSIVPTLRVGMQPQTPRVCGTRSVPGWVPTRSVGTIGNSDASTRMPPFHQKVGPGPGPVRRLSGIVA